MAATSATVPGPGRGTLPSEQQQRRAHTSPPVLATRAVLGSRVATAAVLATPRPAPTLDFLRPFVRPLCRLRALVCAGQPSQGGL